MTVRRITRVDNVQKLKRMLRELKNKKIKIGIFGQDDSHILMIARVQEFGCDITITEKMRWWLRTNGLYVKDSTTEIHIPERSFIRASYDANKNKMDRFITENLAELLSFRIDVDTFLNRIGQYMAGLTQEYLTELNRPANHPFTIERKNGKENPLINSGRLRESITWKVE